jgi:WD40 repeat protein/serine/threonine protein kinase
MTLTPGTLLDHYEIRSLIGEGGMGAAYEAEDLTLKRRVVVKVLHTAGGAGEEAERLLLAEAQRAASINHPNVAIVYEVGHARGLSYIVMERVEGETLAHMIEREPLELRHALDIAIAVAAALDSAHARAVIHCDIKTSNVMLARDASVKVLDFGLARQARQTERATEGAIKVINVSSPSVGARQSSHPANGAGESSHSSNGAGRRDGTPAYMSPEQLRGDPLDARTDIFSLGVVLYEMIAGRKPFAGASRADCIRATLGEEPPPLGAYRDDVPLELEAVVRRALAKDRAERYQTAREIIEDLRRVRARLNPVGVRAESSVVDATEETSAAAHVGALSVWQRIKHAASVLSRRRKVLPHAQASLTDVAFRGLLPFQEADRGRFYGREAETLALLRTVTQAEFRFGILFGESGCGKTSLLKAGLVPKLWEEGFVPIYCRSYTDPLAALLSECRKRTHLEIRDDEQPLDYLRRAAEELDGTLVVILDQFEEFFINFRAETEREPFVSLAAAAFADASLPIKFLISIRGDFLHLISAEFEGRIPDPLMSARLSRLRNFDEASAAAVIERSARAARLPFEDGLSRRVARDLASGGAVLPSELQIVGERLQGRRIFTIQDYRRAGGKEQLVHGFLEDVIESSGEREGAQLVLRSLISEENTRLTLTAPEIARRTQRSRETTAKTLKLFVAARLLREIQDEEPWRYELVHEYLVEKINRVTGRVMDATQRANRLLRQYLSDYALDARARIPLGKLLFIRRYAGAVQTERGRELFRKSLRRGLVRAGALAVALVVSTTLAAAALSVTDEWDGVRLADGHTAAARQVAFSPDGRRLVSVGEDGRVIVWDFASRRRLATLTDHAGAVTTVGFSPDGKWFATGGADKTAIVWDAATFERVATLRDHAAAVTAAAFTPDGKYLATASCTPDERTVLWSVGRWEKVRELRFGNCWGTLPFTPDSRYVVDRRMGVWELETGRNVAPSSTDWEGNWVSVSPDGTLAVAATPGGNVRFFDLKRREQLDNPHVHRDHGRAVAFSPAGRYVATGAEKIMLWDAKTRQMITPLEYSSIVWNLAFSPDGRYLVSTHGDGAILVWDVNTRERVANFNEHVGAVESVAFSRDGRRVASASEDGSVIVWDAASARKENVFADYNNSVNAVAFSPGGAWLATADQDAHVRLLDLARGTAQTMGGGSYCVAISPDERWVATSNDVIERAAGRVTGYPDLNPEANTGCYGVDFSSDGRLLACASSDLERLLVWDAESWRLLDDVRAGGTNFKSVRFSPDGRLIVTGDVQGAVRLWEASPLREMALIGRHAARVNAVAFSPDGSEVASASDDQTVALWDVRRRRLIERVGTHTAPVRSVAFSPDGKKIVTGGDDKSVRLYTRRRTLWGYSLD